MVTNLQVMPIAYHYHCLPLNNYYSDSHLLPWLETLNNIHLAKHSILFSLWSRSFSNREEGFKPKWLCSLIFWHLNQYCLWESYKCQLIVPPRSLNINKSIFSVSAVTKGKQMIPILNASQVQCAVYGNHDFGKAGDTLLGIFFMFSENN